MMSAFFAAIFPSVPSSSENEEIGDDNHCRNKTSSCAETYQ
jgi:hypothetical protein